MELFDRIYTLCKILRGARHPVSFSRLQSELNNCPRSTLKRIIRNLRDRAQAPIKYDRARNGYYLGPGEKGPWELPGLWFNASELHALLAAHEIFANVQPGLLDDVVAPLRERIERILTSRHVGGRDASRRIRILRMASRHIETRHFRNVASAVIQRKRLRIVYHGRERDATTVREISPQRLVHYRENWYCDAWDHAKRALRVFSIDRIRECEMLKKQAKEISDARLHAHFATAYGIFAGKPRRNAVLRFTQARARWIADETWHPEQRGQFLPDGQYQLSVPYADERELILDILKFGPDVEVISPISLRGAIQERLRNALARYADRKLHTKTPPGAKRSKRTSHRKGPLTGPPPSVPLATVSAGTRDFNS